MLTPRLTLLPRALYLPLSLGVLLSLGLLILVSHHRSVRQPKPPPEPVAVVETVPTPLPPPPRTVDTGGDVVGETGLSLVAWLFAGSILSTAFWLVFYLAPTLVACLRHHHNAGAIFALNFFFGWTVLGWFGALVWALTNPPPTSPTVIVQNTPYPVLPPVVPPSRLGEETRYALCQENPRPSPGRVRGPGQPSL